MATTKRSAPGSRSHTSLARGKAKTTVVEVAHTRTPTKKTRGGKPKEPYVINERRK